MFRCCLLLLVNALIIVLAKKETLMVQTLTRHGTRAPDKIVGQKICKTLINPDGGVHHAFVEVFGTGPAELTAVGVQQMRDVGAFLRERYHGFLWADYGAHSREWEFIAREGTRQQRSMMGLVQGIFPNDAVPIEVTQREIDSILGGPAPQCARFTHDYILDWHRTKGPEVLRKNGEIIRKVERVCDISLMQDPVNSIPGGANPHAYIGDISDLMDSLEEANREPLPLLETEHYELTKLAFEMEQHAHFDYPGGDTMHAGDFPLHLLKPFEEIVANGGSRENLPKMRMHTCSRELHYGLARLFGFSDNIKIPGQPQGRIRPGTTFIWELKSDFKIRTYYYQYPDNKVTPLLPPLSVEEYKAIYEEHVSKCGDWKTLCIEGINRCSNGTAYPPKSTIVKPKMMKIETEDDDEEEEDGTGDLADLVRSKSSMFQSFPSSTKEAEKLSETVEDPEEEEEGDISDLAQKNSILRSSKVTSSKLTKSPSSNPSIEEEEAHNFNTGFVIVAVLLCTAVALWFRSKSRSGYAQLS